MRRSIINVIGVILLFTSNAQTANDNSKINDGPYIFIEDQRLVEKSVIDGVVVSVELAASSLDTSYTALPSSYTGVTKIAALSDIHVNMI